MDIRNTLLCVSFSISCWEARKQDKKATREVATNHATDAKVGRYHKDLLPDAAEHEAILKIRNAWRVWHYDNTLPWGDDASRVLRSAAFLDYTQGYNAFKAQFDQACEDFYAAYPTLIAQAQLRLNTLFDARDYPDVSEVRRRFATRINTYPLPNANDFRVLDGITAEEAERLRAEAISGLEAQVTDAMKELWGRMHKVVAAVHERLAVPIGAPGATFRDSLLENVRDLLEVLPRLNLTGDSDIARMAVEMDGLARLEPDTLRASVDARAATAAKAAKLAQQMAVFVGG